MTGPDPRPLARTISGPFGVRECARTDRGYVWSEELTGCAEPYLDDGDLAALSAIRGIGRVTPLFPKLDRPRCARWPAVDVPELLFDEVFAGLPGLPYAPAIFADIGCFLAAVHGIPTVGPLARLPVRHAEPAWLSAAPKMADAAYVAAGELVKLAGPVIARLARGECEPLDGCLVHGRFSVALCVVAEETSILGWREAGLGDPMQDLGFMLGELAECAALRTSVGRSESWSHVARLLAAADALCFGYQEGRGRPLSTDEWDQLARRTARRVLEHMALHVVAFGSVEGPVRLLRLVDEQVDTIVSGARRAVQATVGGSDA